MIKSSISPIRPKPIVTPSASQINWKSPREKQSVAAMRPSHMMRPPIVGVPALERCVLGPSSRTCWPNLRRFNKGIPTYPAASATQNETSTA
jgi:hypothetical protein